MGLQHSCQELLDEQKKLIALAEELETQLAYFNELDPIMQFLNAPGEDLVLNPNFQSILGKLDQCLAFMEQHVNSINVARVQGWITLSSQVSPMFDKRIDID